MRAGMKFRSVGCGNRKEVNYSDRFMLECNHLQMLNMSAAYRPGFCNTSIGCYGSIVASQSLQRHSNEEPQLSKIKTNIFSKIALAGSLVLVSMLLLSACSVSKQISRKA